MSAKNWWRRPQKNDQNGEPRSLKSGPGCLVPKCPPISSEYLPNIFRISSEYLQRWRHVFSDSFIIAVDENPNRSKTCPESTHISGAFSEVRRDAGRVCATSRRPLHFGRFFADGATNSLRTALRIHLRRFFGVPKSPDLCPKTCGRRPVFFADSVQSRGIQQIAALNFADSAT